MSADITLRVARPTDRLDEVVRFYSVGLGLSVLESFQDHDGFDGAMLGHPGAPYHLEFTRKRGHRVGRAPTQDNLLVFYLPDTRQWQEVVDRMRTAGYEPVPSFNPYWDRSGRTFEEPRRLPRRAGERLLPLTLVLKRRTPVDEEDRTP